MLFDDQPISDKADDRLNRFRFVQQLSSAILAWKSEDALTIGLYGGWGDGKTSVLNMLSEELKGQCSVLFFDPWFFNSQEELILKFLESVFLEASTQLGYFAGIRLRRNARRFARAITSVPLSISYQGVGLKLSDLRPKASKPSDKKSDLEKLLDGRSEKKKQKITVLIDNLDRLPPHEMLLMLKLVRLCNDFRDFVYVLAFDRGVLAESIRSELYSSSIELSGEDFLGKIIQTDLHLPAIAPDDIDQFINEAFDELQSIHGFEWNDDFTSRFPPFYQKNLKAKLIRNLRDVKKLANGASFTLPLTAGEINQADWLVTEAIRVFAPSSYELMRMSIEILCPAYSSIGYRWNTADRSRWHDRYQSIVEAIDDFPDFTLASFDFLFPQFASWRSNPSNPTMLAQDLYTQFTKDQRIASPEYRFAYFQFGPEKSKLSDNLVSEFISSLNDASAADRIGIVEEMLQQVANEGQVKDLLDKLILRIDLIDESARGPLVNTLAANSKSFSKEESFFMNSEEARAQALIFALASPDAPGAPAQALIQQSIVVAQENSFAVDMLLFVTPDRNRIIRNFNVLDFDELGETLKNRLRRSYLTEEADVFSDEPNSASYILFQWSGPLLGDRESAARYLDRMFKREPSYLGTFLSGFVKTDPLSKDDTRWTFDMERLREAFAIDWVEKHAATIMPEEIDSEKGRWALAEFQSATMGSTV